MMNPESDADYTCENCGETIVVPIDLSQGRYQEYVEDCPVCCCPNVIRVEVDDTGDIDLRGSSEQDLM